MLNKIGSISAPINHYQSGGKQNTFYQPVGTLMKNPQTGEILIFLEKWFNPMATLGASNPEKGSICLAVKLEESLTRAQPTPQSKPTEKQVKPTTVKKAVKKANTKRQQRPSPEAVRAAMELINTDMLMKQNEGKDGKHIDLPFDNEITEGAPFNDKLPF